MPEDDYQQTERSTEASSRITEELHDNPVVWFANVFIFVLDNSSLFLFIFFWIRLFYFIILRVLFYDFDYVSETSYVLLFEEFFGGQGFTDSTVVRHVDHPVQLLGLV